MNTSRGESRTSTNSVVLLICKSADIALQQIEEKHYAKAFKGDGRTIYKIGVNFSSETRRMTEWKIA